MKPGSTVRHTGRYFPGRTGTVVEPLPRDAAWPGYVRVQLDTAPDGSRGACTLLEVESLERVERAGQMDLLRGAA